MPHLEPIHYDLDMWLVVFPAAFILMDVFSGFVKAFATRSISSAKMRDGLAHKLGFMLALVLAVMVEVAVMRMDLGFTVPLVAPVAAYIVLTEVASVLENIAEISPELKGSKLFELFKTKENTHDR